MKTVKAIISLAIVAAAFYVGWNLLPPYFNNYKFEDAIAEEARLNTYTAKSENDIREAVYKKAKDLDIPITTDQIVVHREGSAVSISVEYTVHVELPIHPVDLKFHPSSKDKAI